MSKEVSFGKRRAVATSDAAVRQDISSVSVRRLTKNNAIIITALVSIDGIGHSVSTGIAVSIPSDKESVKLFIEAIKEVAGL